MAESFLLERENVGAIVMVMDVRREWAEEEQMLLDTAHQMEYEFCVALTKADKLSRNQAMSKKLKLSRIVKKENVFLISSLKKTGFVELERGLYKWLIADKK